MHLVLLTHEMPGNRVGTRMVIPLPPLSLLLSHAHALSLSLSLKLSVYFSRSSILMTGPTPPPSPYKNRSSTVVYSSGLMRGKLHGPEHFVGISAPLPCPGTQPLPDYLAFLHPFTHLLFFQYSVLECKVAGVFRWWDGVAEEAFESFRKKDTSSSSPPTFIVCGVYGMSVILSILLAIQKSCLHSLLGFHTGDPSERSMSFLISLNSVHCCLRLSSFQYVLIFPAIHQLWPSVK